MPVLTGCGSVNVNVCGVSIKSGSDKSRRNLLKVKGPNSLHFNGNVCIGMHCKKRRKKLQVAHNFTFYRYIYYEGFCIYLSKQRPKLCPRLFNCTFLLSKDCQTGYYNNQCTNLEHIIGVH